jgi:hypothetical protein
MKNLLVFDKPAQFKWFLNKTDVYFVILQICLSIYYIYETSKIIIPIWDATVNLANAHSWLLGIDLSESYRPQLLSWIIAFIWLLTGENWMYAKLLSPFFTIAAGFILYLALRKYKTKHFSFAVSALTMLNAQVFFWSTQIMTESISLFFVVLTLYLLKSRDKTLWFLGGIAIGLTFASRYPIFLQAALIFVIESLIHRNLGLSFRAMGSALATIIIVIFAIYQKSGEFMPALPSDMQFSATLSSAYLLNSIDIWGIAFILVPIAFVFRRTYRDKYNYVFIAWFIFAMVFWSSNSGIIPYKGRYAIQFTPAVYYLAVLAIENIWNTKNLSRASLYRVLRRAKTTDIMVTSDIDEAKKLLSRGWKYETSYAATRENIPHFVLRKLDYR